MPKPFFVEELIIRLQTLVQRKLQLEPDIAPDALEKERLRFLPAPCIVAVIATPINPHKIPICEQIASAAAVCMQLLNSAHGMGFGAQWLTGWAAAGCDPSRMGSHATSIFASQVARHAGLFGSGHCAGSPCIGAGR